MSFFGGIPSFFNKTIKPGVNDTYDIGAADKIFRSIYGQNFLTYADNGTNFGGMAAGNTFFAFGSFTAGVPIYLYTEGAVFYHFNSTSIVFETGTYRRLKPNTVDGSDNFSLGLCGGGDADPTRGSYIEIYGNEYSSKGMALVSGNVSTSPISLITSNNSSNIRIRPDNPTGGKGFDVLGSNGAIQYQSSSFIIAASTSDGVDTAQVTIGGGGGNGTNDRGGGLVVYGNESAGAGAFTLYTGDIAGTFGTIVSKTTLRLSLAGDSDNVIFDGASILFDPNTGSGYQIASNTSDGSDDKILYLCGGGTFTASRGCYVALRGNEASAGGQLDIVPGDATGSKLRLYGGQASASIEFVTGIGPSVAAWNMLSGGDLASQTAGVGLRIKEGSNARMGTATLVAGTVTVSNTSVTANSRIFLSRNTTGGTTGHLSTTIVAGTSFTINSSNALDTSVVAWLLIEPSA